VDECLLYVKAKEKVLFEGFEWVESFDKFRFILRKKGENQVWAEMTKLSDAFYFRFPSLYTQKIEDLVSSEVLLTDSALKQIGL